MMIIRIFGVPTDTGVGIHSRKIYESAKKIADDRIRVEWLSKYEMQDLANAIGSSTEEDINVFLFYSPGLTKLYKGIHLFWYAFESTVPMMGIEILNEEFHFIVSPSEWGRSCLINYGVAADRVFVLPEGVDPWLYHPYPHSDRTDTKTRFLMVGKFETRKGYIEAIEAFNIAFAKNPNIELLVKPDWVVGEKSRLSSSFVKLVLQNNHLPIKTVNSILTPNQMRDLYRSADYFLFPSRCEGWGLPLIEAIACGVPAICCDFGGQSEYLRTIPDGYLSIPYHLDDIDCPKWKEDFPTKNGIWGQWAKIDVTNLAELILKASFMDFREKALTASEYVRREFSWDNAAEKLIKLAQKIRIDKHRNLLPIK
jgi:glycosyltransferase involved in cell wall biosynthesis